MMSQEHEEKEIPAETFVDRSRIARLHGTAVDSRIDGAAGDEAAEQAAQPGEQPDADEVDVPASSEETPLTRIAELEAKLQRAQADYQNLSKRMLKEQDRWHKRAVSELARDLFPALDSFERALQSPGQSVREFVKGLGLIRDQLLNALENNGIQPMRAEGEPFDPNSHEALSMLQNPSVPDQTVLQVVETGYRYRAEVLRPAKVIVARGGPTRDLEEEETGEDGCHA